MIPDEILWRIALHWPDLGHDWNRVGWNLVAVDDSRSASCLPDLISPTYVLVMHGLLGDMAHRPHGLLEITSGNTCHVRATVLPSRINLPILQKLLHAICRRGWPMVRCVGTHNRIALTDELQLCSQLPGWCLPMHLMSHVGVDTLRRPTSRLPILHRGFSSV